MATTETISENEVDIKNIGPIDHLRLPIEPGSITVLTGANGAGKSQALDAVDALSRGKGRLASKDGTVNGTAVGFGVRIKVGRGGANRRTDLSEELHVESLDDRLSIAELVDPGLKDSVAADARRIKALVALAETPADPALFYEVCGGDQERFDSLVSPEARDKDDVVAMAAAIKRDLEAASRKSANEAENARRDLAAQRQSNEGIDLDAPSDGQALQEELEHAISVRASVKERIASGEAAKQSARDAEQRLQAIEGGDAEHVDALVSELGACDDRLRLAKDRVRRAQEEWDAAHDELNDASRNQKTIEDRLTAARQHAATREEAQRTIEAAKGIEVPTTDDLQAAEAAVQTAREAVEQGARVRDARLRSIDIERKELRVRDLDAAAESLRDSAKATEDVLTRIVAEMGGPFRVDEEFRLIVRHPRRGECYYADLSQGERWILGLDAAIESFKRRGTRGLLVIPQHAWEALDGRNRKLIADHIAGTDLAVLTAEASKSEDPAAEVGVAVFN